MPSCSATPILKLWFNMLLLKPSVLKCHDKLLLYKKSRKWETNLLSFFSFCETQYSQLSTYCSPRSKISLENRWTQTCSCSHGAQCLVSSTNYYRNKLQHNIPEEWKCTEKIGEGFQVISKLASERHQKFAYNI